MILKPHQIDSALQLISKNILVYIGFNLGEAVLTGADMGLLKSMGIDMGLLQNSMPSYFRMFLLGRLTQMIGDYNSQQLQYADFEAYLQRQQFQPLTPFEEIQYTLARRAAYSHLKNLEHRMRFDVENDILEEISRAEYEQIIKEETEAGVVGRKSITNIVSDIGHRTTDWSKDLGRIVDTEMNNIFQKGRIVEITRDNPGKDPLVYKDVYEGACRHCIALYLTNGLGSAPRLFKLSALVANGSNIGRKVADWKATVDGCHPFCRCNTRRYVEGMIWSKTEKQFVYDNAALEREAQRLGIKGKIRIQVGDRVVYA